MISKFLEKRIEIIPQEIKDGLGNPMELEYYLVECNSEFNEAEKGFGVEIIMKNKGIVSESIMVSDIFTTREHSEDLIRKLFENSVTPVSLPYILDDMIGV